jgi:hypothetical protein
MPETPNTISEKLEALAQEVRKASGRGHVIPFGELWKGTEEEFLALSASNEESAVLDIALIRHEDHGYFYSKSLMTRSYAKAAARGWSKNICLAIAETVREDSRVYPRPTPVEIFSEAPFRISKDSLSAAMEEITGDPRYSDIRLVCASDGSRYLFSSIYLDASQAKSIAEWTAVGLLENP